MADKYATKNNTTKLSAASLESDIRLMALMKKKAEKSCKTVNASSTANVCEPCVGRTSYAQLLENLL